MECGWDHKFIARTFTMSQIRRYYQSIQDQKFNFLGIALQGIMASTAAGYGNIKPKAFYDFVDQFLMKTPKKNVDGNKSFEKMKGLNLPIEDK